MQNKFFLKRKPPRPSQRTTFNSFYKLASCPAFILSFSVPPEKCSEQSWARAVILKFSIMNKFRAGHLQYFLVFF